MSQKYKSFSKGQALDLGSALPPGVKKVGYLRKLKKMKKRFFVLHSESNYGIARLEYYSSEKKWKYSCEPRRCIDLKTCLNISHKLHSKQKNIIAFYTQYDCFSVAADSTQEFEDWLKDILEVYRNCIDDNSKNRLVYEHLWQVIIDKHDLEYDKLLAGPYRVALTAKSLFLIKINPLGENDYLEFPLMSIRRCGHSKDHFFIELGRSAVTGAGEIYMATEATIVAQNMHETVLNAMKSSKTREDPLPRPRSASSSENSSLIPLSRPIGVVAPQTFSNSRERCDSLPTRPQTILGENFSSFSSPCTSVGSLSKDVRPHSMYEWPSFNSPSAHSSMFSPGSFSGGNSSTENVSSRQQSLNYNPYSLLSCGNSSSGRQVVESKNECLKTSPSNEKSNLFNYVPRKKSSDTSLAPSEYVDMKAIHKPGEPMTEKVSAASNYMAMAGGRASDEEPVTVQAGYIDMSPSNSLPNNSDFNERLNNFHHNTKNDKELLKSFKLEKVLSLLQVKDTTKNISESCKNKPPVTINDISSNNRLKTIPQNSSNSETFVDIKPPIPERTCCKSESKRSPVSPNLKGYNISISENSVKCLDVKHELNPVQRKKAKLGKLDVFYSDSALLSSRAPNVLYSTDQCLVKSKANASVKGDDVNKNPSSDGVCDNFQSDSSAWNCKETLQVESTASNIGDYVNINLEKIERQASSEKQSTSLYPCDPNYSNVQFGKPFCPLPNPNLATSNTTFSSSLKSDGSTSQSSKYEEPRVQCVVKPPLYSGPDTVKNITLAPTFRNIPNTLPAFRKQMSAPAGPLSLRPELPSPGRKSSCPVTASMEKSVLSPILHPVHLQSAHLRVFASRSPDHSSVSSVSSTSDEISSTHSSPKILSQNFSAIDEQVVTNSQYENIVIPQSVNSEKELNYASLDLAPSKKETAAIRADEEEKLTYAEIDFTKSEGLKNTSGSLREGRL